MAGTVFVKSGEQLTVIGVPADAPVPPYVPGPVDPGYSPPWAQVPPGGQGGGPVDPGYSPPWAQVRPPVDPGYSPPWAQVPPGGTQPPNWRPEQPTHPIANPWPPYVDANPPQPQPPIDPAQPPNLDNGNWTWAWSPQAGRWVWVKVPGEGEAGPKAA